MNNDARRFLSLLVVVGALVGLLHVFGLSVVAREIGANPTGVNADQACFGGRIAGNTVKAATEACLDASGNWIPTTSNGANLGTAALPWNNVFAANQLITGQNSLSVQTTTQIAVLVPVQVGALVLAQESVGGSLVTNTYNLCASTDTKAGDFVYVSVSTSVPAVLGAKCSS